MSGHLKPMRLLLVEQATKEGLTAKEISKKYGIAISSVYRYTSELNLIPNLKIENADVVKKLYEEGMTKKHIAEQTGLSLFKVRKVINTSHS